MGGFAFFRHWAPFRPDQKVKLDKTGVGIGGLSLRNGFLALAVELPRSSKKSLSGHPPFSLELANLPSVPGFPAGGIPPLRKERARMGHPHCLIVKE
jgi:hypothetical protein